MLASLALLAGLVDPRNFWLPAIFAPVLPWLLLLVFFLFLWQGYRKKYREALIPLLVLVLAIPSVRKIIAWPSAMESATAEMQEMRLLTANVASMKSPKDHYPLDSAGVVEFAKRVADADVLFVQEYPYKGRDWRTSLIKQEGNYKHFIAAEGGALAIFANAQLRKQFEHFPVNNVNGVFSVDVSTESGDVFRCINVHLQSNRVTGMADQISQDGGPDKGTWQIVRNMFGRYGRAARQRTIDAENITALINDSPLPVILAGDFNDVPTSFPYRILRTPRLRDAWLTAGSGLGATFDGALPGLRIDYMLIDTSLIIQGAQNIPSGHADHHPVQAILNLPVTK